MDCTYWVSDIELSADMTEAELDKFWAEWKDYFTLQLRGDHADLSQQSSEMGYSTAVEVDIFIEKIAERLKGTKCDQQVLEWDYDSEAMGYMILHGGIVDKTETENLILNKGEEPVWLKLANGQSILMGGYLPNEGLRPKAQV